MASKYWFRPKAFGYGASPSSIEGWLLTFGYVAIVGAAAAFLLTNAARQSPGAWIVFLAVVLCLTVALIVISRAKTDGDWRWRWGSGRSTRADQERM